MGTAPSQLVDNDPTKHVPPPIVGDLFRAYIVDVETDPDNPTAKVVFTRGEVYTATQSMIRGLLSGGATDKDKLYTDAECTVEFEFEAEVWSLAKIRKEKARKTPAGLDKEWVKILLARTDLTSDQKMAEIARFT